MSADTFIAYCGLRFEVSPDEIEGLELRADPRILVARKYKINYYFGRFGIDREKHLLFIGFPVGIFGIENSFESTISITELHHLYENTQERLKDAGFDGNRTAFHFILEPDF